MTELDFNAVMLLAGIAIGLACGGLHFLINGGSFRQAIGIGSFSGGSVTFSASMLVVLVAPSLFIS